MNNNECVDLEINEVDCIESNEGFHKRCHDCGHFVEKKLWVSKDDRRKKHPLCSDCYSLYDDPDFN